MALQKITTDIIADNAVTGSKISVAPVGQTPAAGDIVYFTGTDYVKLAIGTADHALTVVNGMPQWSAYTGSPSSPSSFTGNAWILGGTQGAIPSNNLLYYSFSSNGHAVVGAMTEVAGHTDVESCSGSTHNVASTTEGFFFGQNAKTTALPLLGSVDTCSKFTFASATDSANPTTIERHGDSAGHVWGSGRSGIASATHGYIGGGRQDNGVAQQTASVRKLTFASVNASVLTTANIGSNKSGVRGTGNSTGGLFVGGLFASANNNSQSYQSGADAFTYASETCQINWSNLSVGSGGGSSAGNETDGYFYGGYINPPNIAQATVIERFTYSNSSSRVDHGNLLFETTGGHGAQTATHGFNVGGINHSVLPIDWLGLSTVTGYSFASDAVGTNTSDIQLIVRGSVTGTQVPTISF